MIDLLVQLCTQFYSQDHSQRIRIASLDSLLTVQNLVNSSPQFFSSPKMTSFDSFFPTK